MGSSICLNCSTSDCTIAELRQQLADARLLARANHRWVLFDQYPGKPSGGLVIQRKAYAVELNDGLPILTDEVRAALQKAIGDT